MRDTSDYMQDLAQAFGERNALEYCISTLKTLKNAENIKVMTSVFRLFGVECVTRDLGWYLCNKVLSKQAVSGLKSTRIKLI